MEAEKKYLTHLLRAFVLEQPPQRQETDWEKLTQLAGIHNVAGIMGHMACTYRLCDDPELRARLRQLTMGTMVSFSRRAAACQRLCAGLREAGIVPVLMKGAVVRDYYPVPELRTFGDVDILIRAEDRQASHEKMLHWGFACETDWGSIYSYRRGDEHYELHTELLEVDIGDQADYRGYFGKVWEHTVPRGDGCLELSPEFHFLYLLTHIAKHIGGSGAGVRMYLDLAVFIRKLGDKLDWDWIRRELEGLKLLTFAGTAMDAVEQWFGVRCPMERQGSDEALLDRFFDFTMEAGVFGKHNREAGEEVLVREGTEGRAGTVLRQAFPSAKTLQTRYTYLQKRPWLLPVAWVHRLVLNRKKLGSRAKQAKTILSADEQVIRQRQSLKRDIGL